MIFDAGFRPVATGQREFEQHFPNSGWVEHEPEDLWRTTVETAREAIAGAGLGAGAIAAVGITNQRETAIVWDRDTGRAIARAIVWQDRRTADLCQRLRREGLEPLFTERTGLALTRIQRPMNEAEARDLLARDLHRAWPTERGMDFLSDLQELFLPSDGT